MRADRTRTGPAASAAKEREARRIMYGGWFWIGWGWIACGLAAIAAAEESPAQRGYRLLTTKAYLPPDFHESDLDAVWQVWEEPARSQAQAATPAERRKLAFARYGLTSAPGGEEGSALQYVRRADGGWSMNCFACHGGKVAGRVIPGLPNAHFALETLTADLRLSKAQRGRKLARMDLALFAMPLGGSNGTTNAAMFGVALLALRRPDLTVDRELPKPKLTHHDLDAPPWWHFRRKTALYIDGFAPQSHRALMQFLLVPENGPGEFQEWEADFRDVQAYLESLAPPAYPFEIDRPLAARGAAAFRQHCAECHGTYGPEGKYPERLVPIDEIGTDRVRLDALDERARRAYEQSWFSFQGEKKANHAPGGYVAPPLDGIWATAPYLHNGSVPTLWHLLHPGERPVVWSRTEDGYDTARVGLEAAAFDDLPRTATSFTARHRFFDTRLPGKSAAGHRFPERLTPEERRAVLEYLKTL